MAEREKIEPFWSRSARAKRTRKPVPVLPVGEPAAPGPSGTKEEAPAARDADGEPREPVLLASSAERRNTIAAIIAEATAPDPAPAEPPAAGPDGWIALPPEEAERHPLFGVRGGLVAVAVLIALGLSRALIEIVDFWATTDHGGLAAWIMAVLRSTMALWAALLMGLLIARSRAFPANFVAYGLFNIIYLVLFALAFAHVTQNMSFAGSAIAIGFTLVAMAYVMRSRRANVTFRRRVRAKDAILLVRRAA